MPNSDRDRAREVDVLIVAALKLEFDAVVDVSRNLPPGDAWIESRIGPYEYQTRAFDREHGLPPLRVALVRSTEMGEVFAAACAARLLEALNPSILAMCGVCAGREGSVELGDVVVADRLYKYDGGASVSTSRSDPEYRLSLLADIRTYNMPLEWRVILDGGFKQPWTELIGQDRPIPVAEQARWLAAKLAENSGGTLREIYQRSERVERCAKWQEAVSWLARVGWLSDDWNSLSEHGVTQASRELVLFPSGRPTLRVPELRVGAIATGARVQRDVQLFDRLDAVSRRTIGVEMEGAALAAVAEIHGQKMIMAKGVMDFADPDKDDGFKAFAARAAGAFVLSFLIGHARPTQTNPGAGPCSSRPTVSPSAPQDGESPANHPAPAVRPNEQTQGTATFQVPTQGIILLRAPLSEAVVGSWLKQTGWVSAASVRVADDDAAAYNVTCEEVEFSRVLRDFRRERIRSIHSVPVDYIAEVSADNGDDPNRGRFGSRPRRNGRMMRASVSRSDGDWYECEVRIQSTDRERPLPDSVTLHVHPSLIRDPIILENVDGVARFPFEAWGSFCVGAEIREVDGSVTMLEIDMANVAGVPRRFIEE